MAGEHSGHAFARVVEPGYVSTIRMRELVETDGVLTGALTLPGNFGFTLRGTLLGVDGEPSPGRVVAYTPRPQGDWGAGFGNDARPDGSFFINTLARPEELILVGLGVAHQRHSASHSAVPVGMPVDTLREACDAR